MGGGSQPPSPCGRPQPGRGQALAALRGRDYVTPDDVQGLVEPVLAHRLIPSARQRLYGLAALGILSDLLAKVPVPVEERWDRSSEG